MSSNAVLSLVWLSIDVYALVCFEHEFGKVRATILPLLFHSIYMYCLLLMAITTSCQRLLHVLNHIYTNRQLLGEST
jgi:hypothetical protein